jgi:DNA polymerase III alpha subunit
MKRPEKFVGLHAHSGFSTYDGMSYPQDHIDYVRQNNMSAWALTDHGHMNGFAHAYLHAQKLNKAGANFKFIPGCEMYVHPDLDVWKLDYEIKQAAKRGDTSALKMLRDEREKIQTPLVALTYADD